MPTPHIAARPGDFAPVCLLPGDPLRARYVAEEFLEDPVQVTSIRNMEGYTGSHRGRPLSVMGTGMGIPSLSIYATELIRQFGVTSLIRIGSCGGIHPDLGLRDLVVASGASTDSNVNRLRFDGYDFAAVADFELTRLLVDAARHQGVTVRVGNILSSDLFYHPRPEIFESARRMGLLAVEMEAAGLFAVAAEEGVRAAAVMTVSDLIGRDAKLTTEERRSSLDQMIRVALAAAVEAEDPDS